jgi:hypothetical protein
VSFIAYQRSTFMNQEKYIGLDVHQATISIAILDWTGKVVVESILRNESGYHSAVHSRIAEKLICNLRRRNLGSLVVRSVEAACFKTGSVQSTKERAAQRGHVDCILQFSLWVRHHKVYSGRREADVVMSVKGQSNRFRTGSPCFGRIQGDS